MKRKFKKTDRFFAVYEAMVSYEFTEKSYVKGIDKAGRLWYNLMVYEI